jgi:hypothetical protein
MKSPDYNSYLFPTRWMSENETEGCRTIFMPSTTNLCVIAFLVVVAVWLFIRPQEFRDRAFLAVAGIIYIAAMYAQFWKFGNAGKGRLIGSLLVETTGLLLVALSKREKKTTR